MQINSVPLSLHTKLFLCEYFAIDDAILIRVIRFVRVACPTCSYSFQSIVLYIRYVYYRIRALRRKQT